MTLRRLAPWLILAAGAVAYSNSFAGVFVLDDLRYITDNLWLRLFFYSNGGPAYTSRPTVDLTLAVNFLLGRFDPWGYHLFNLAVHLTVPP